MSASVSLAALRSFVFLFVWVLLVHRGRTNEAAAVEEVRIYRDDICVGVSLGQRIGFGFSAEENAWPWHGALLYGKDYKCGCTLISEWFVLTAAHCVINQETGIKLNRRNLRVMLGCHNLNEHKSHTREYDVVEIKAHPQFVRTNLKHDLALLLLNGRVETNEFVTPINLIFTEPPWIEHLAGTLGTVVGWGVTESDAISNTLMVAHMPIVRYTDCVESNPDVFGRLIHSGMYCAGAQNGTSVCNGDSGGGMYIYQNNRWNLRGVVSFAAVRDGTNLCDLYNYAAFVNVPYYGKWIEQQLMEHGAKAEQDNNVVEEHEPLRPRVDLIIKPSENSTSPENTTLTELLEEQQQQQQQQQEQQQQQQQQMQQQLPESTTINYIPTTPATIDYSENVPAECLQQHNRIITVERESSISLHCNHDFSDKVHFVRWFRENKYHQYVDISAEFGFAQDFVHDILTLRHLEARHSGRYFCRVEADQRTHLDNRTLAVTGVLPRFEHASKPSFMKFQLSLKQDYFNLKISFRAEKNSGVIFHKDNECGNQLMTLALVDGRPEFRFQTRNKIVRTLSNAEYSVRLGQWHTIQISTLRGRGYFSLDDHLLVLFQESMLISDCVVESVFLGGIPYANSTGFTGCISSMSLNDISIDFWKESIESQHISHCTPCFPDPCMNGGTCIETVDSEGYSCLCKAGFIGKHCTKVGESCSSQTCVQGYCSNDESGFHCFCPPFRTGKKCENENQVDGKAIAFSSSGFAMYNVQIGSDLFMQISFIANSIERSVLAYLLEDNRDTGNFMALVVKDNRLELRFSIDLEVRMSVLKSSVLLEKNVRYTVTTGYRNEFVFLQVNEEPEISKSIFGDLFNDEHQHYLYIGGLDQRNVKTRCPDMKTGFNGCIDELKLSYNSPNVIVNFIDARNIEPCD